MDGRGVALGFALPGEDDEGRVGLARLFVTSAIGTTYGNPSGYKNPEVDALFEKAEKATTPADRGAIYRQVQGIVGVALPVFPLREKAFISGMSRKLQGLEEKDADKFGLWRNVWLTK